jgi:lipid-binding SYLF domain-containing protein
VIEVIGTMYGGNYFMKTIMKSTILGLTLSFLTSAALADDSVQLDKRISMLTDKFEAFQHRQDGGIPSENLRRAQGIILLDTTKGGLVFGYQAGNGVAMVKNAALRTWSPVAFLKANEASFGAQIGGQENFYIILLMTSNSTWRLIDPKIEVGAGAGGTVGETSGGVATKTPAEPEMLIYSERTGLFGGAVVKGGGISADNEDNRLYYGQDVTIRDILFDNKVQPTATASTLASKIRAYAHDRDASASTKN